MRRAGNADHALGKMTSRMKAGTAQGPRDQFCQEVRRATRATGISAGAIATVGYPSWTLFDYLVEPTTGDDLLPIRLLLTIPIALFWAALLFTRLGHRHPERLLLAICLTINTGIALMIAQVETHYAAYALGMSLTVYAGAFLLIWSPAYMAALCGSSLAILTLVLLLSEPIATDAVATVYFYFGTACLLSFFGQLHRQRTAFREFEGRVALEHEQERSAALVGELDRQSREDSLTGLANRRAWDEALARECASVARDGHDLAILLCDLDCLKAINDALGHAVGDTVLKNVGRLLRRRGREADLIARIGGDEFAVLSPGTDLLGGVELGEQLRALVERDANAAAGLGGVTISVGVAHWEGGDDSPETLMLRADRRLYAAKATRNVVCAGDPPGRR